MQLAGAAARRLRVGVFLVALTLLSFVAGGSMDAARDAGPAHADDACLIVCAAVGMVALAATRPTPRTPGGCGSCAVAWLPLTRDLAPAASLHVDRRARSVYELAVLQT